MGECLLRCVLYLRRNACVYIFIIVFVLPRALTVVERAVAVAFAFRYGLQSESRIVCKLPTVAPK